jgi:hypothetical protein
VLGIGINVLPAAYPPTWRRGPRRSRRNWVALSTAARCSPSAWPACGGATRC